MKIDFVIPWVDGSDPEWRKQKNQYSGKPDEPIDMSDERYRDWDILKYWFRGVEKYAPWVNRVFFVTCGQKPNWLNTDHKKLTLVDHKDYIPEQYLPTFSANPIELNFHRIKGLSEHFVYFNDDMFLTSAVQPTDFFRHELPCDLAVEEPISPDKQDVFMHILMNNMVLLNEQFDRKKVLREQWKKFYLVKDKKSFMMNWSFILWKRHDFFGLKYSHLPAPYLRSCLQEVWKTNESVLDEVCHHRFRSASDVNQYIFKNYQIATGKFTSYNWKKLGKAFHMNDDDNSAANNISEMCKAIADGQYKMICINESEIRHFERTQKQVVQAFERLLPEKSSFEK